MGRNSETQNGLSYPNNMAMPPYLGSSDLKRLKDDGFPPENRGLYSQTYPYDSDGLGPDSYRPCLRSAK